MGVAGVELREDVLAPARGYTCKSRCNGGPLSHTITNKLPASIVNPFSRLSPECQGKANSTSVEVVSDFTWANQGVFDTNPPVDVIKVWKCFRPRDPYQISKTITIAEAEHRCIRAVGSGWSYSDAAIPQAPDAALGRPGELGYIVDSSAFSSRLDSQLDQILAPS